MEHAHSGTLETGVLLAQSGFVSYRLVGDRFVRDGSGPWLDLATGDRAIVRVHPLVGPWAAVEQALREECLSANEPHALIDFGRVGAGAWFEARATAPREEPIDRAAEDAARRLAMDAAGNHRGVRYVRLPMSETRAAVVSLLAAPRLRSAGFVTVRAGLSIGSTWATALAHRHVMLVLCDARDRSQVVWWVRALARASPRSHLVADLAGPEPCGAAVTLRDRLDERDVPSVAPLFGTRFHVRTGELDIAAAARRWLYAADCERADSTLAEAEVLAEGVASICDPAVALARAELRFWLGRFEDAAAACPTCLEAHGRDRGRTDLGAEIVAWRGLIAWARRQPPEIRRARDELVAPRRRPSSGMWAAALAALEASLAGDRVAVRASADRLGAYRRTSPGDAAWIARLAVAEALGTVGDAAATARLMGWPAGWTAAPPLHRLVAERLAGRAKPEEDASLTARINRAGAYGVRRWGNSIMHLWHALPAMLQLVHDAEDEQGALSGGCAWLRKHGGALGVAFLSGLGEVVHADGWPGARLDDETLGHVLDVTAPRIVNTVAGGLAVAPVRYAGRPIGCVVARGRGGREDLLVEGAATIAALGAPALRARLDALALARDSHRGTPEIIGRSPALVAVRDAIARAAAAPFPVLIDGESGTGKELVARAIHRLSPRRDRRFSAVNCAALGDELIEAELFGHARGAFTGAVGPRAGLFEDAHGGTLMLDEVSELSARAQAKLLRVLQEREVRRLGENAARPVDVRAVAATNRPLGELAGRGRFRADLLFRLAVIRLRLPPLRERLEDVPLIAHAAWRDLTRQAGKRTLLGPDAVAALCRYEWPGNVRELQNVIAALVVDAPVRGRTNARAVARVLGGDVPDAGCGAVPLASARTSCEREAIATALARHDGRRGPAARDLGLTRQGLAKAIKRLGLGGPDNHAGVA